MIKATEEEKRTRLGDQECQGQTAVLNRVLQVGLTKKVTAEQRLDRGQGMSHREKASPEDRTDSAIV